MRTPSSLALAALAVVACAVLPAVARADNADATARSTARQVGQEAAKLFEAGDYAGALEKFNTADSLLPSPTLGLYAARCLVKLGRLVEGSERYLEVTRMQLDRNAAKVMRKAQADAVAEREKLLPTIPTLEIRVSGPLGDGVTVVVDGKPLLAGLLGEKRPVNPGRYALEARRVDTTVTKSVTVAASEATAVVLELPPLPPPPTSRMPVLRKLGWAAIGASGAGVIIGGVSGLVALSKGNSLLQKCANHVCSNASDFAQAGSYDTARAASTAGFVIAGVALAAGVPILVLSPRVEYVFADGRPAPPPKDAPAARLTLTPWVGAGAAGLRGAF